MTDKEWNELCNWVCVGESCTSQQIKTIIKNLLN